MNNVPIDVWKIILDAAIPVPNKLLPWVIPSRLAWHELSRNPNALSLLEANQDLINWDYLCQNPNPEAIQLIEQRPDKINWTNLSANPNAIHILEANHRRINWDALSTNPAAMNLLEANPARIDWDNLSTNPSAIDMLYDNFDEISWFDLHANPNSLEMFEEYPCQIDVELASQYSHLTPILEANQARIDWSLISKNTNPRAIRLIEANMDYMWNNPQDRARSICWLALSANPSAIRILEDNLYHVKWHQLATNPSAIHILQAHQMLVNHQYLSKNPAIFEPDYEGREELKRLFLQQYVLN